MNENNENDEALNEDQENVLDEEVIESTEKISRELTGKIGFFVWGFCVIISLAHLWWNSFGILTVIQQNLAHLSLLMGVTYLITPAFKSSPQNRPSFFDVIFCFLSLACGVYFFFGYSLLIDRMMIPVTYDYIYGLVLSLLLIEASRRKVGKPLTILGLVFVIYVYVGPYMPGELAHRGFGWERILTRMTMTTEGVLGIAVTVSATYVWLFILFSSILKESGAADFFNDLAQAIAGSSRGGPAKVSIFASALTGTINGSSQANVVTTGAFTIPLMKKTGYKPFFAGAIEAIASTGGIMMPPIMGAAAFIMSALIGMPYATIIAAAATPSVLYYFALYKMVDFRAAKMGIEGLKKEETPNLKEVILDKGYLILPLFVIIIFLVVLGYSAIFAGFAGIISCVLAAAIKKETRLSFKNILDALAEATEVATSIAIICGIIGFVIGSVGMTGLGQTIGSNIVRLAGGNLVLTLILTMFIAIILGMGLPSHAAYITTATIAAPALTVLGIDILPAHFFVFYYGIMSAVIPPVALTSFTAGVLARANENKVAIYGFFIGAAGLLLPFMYIYNPVILMIDFTLGNYIFSVLSLAVGLYFTAAVVIGMMKKPLSVPERAIFLAVALFLIVPNIYTRIAGLIIAGILYYLNRKQAQKHVMSDAT